MTIRALSTLLEDLNAGLSGDKISFGEIIDSFHERGFGFFLFLFALPATLPVPGLALPIVFLTGQMALGRHTIWMPEGLRRKTVSRKAMEKLIKASLPWTRRLERLLRPRLGWMTHGIASRIAGVAAFLIAASALSPIPFTHTVPSIGIALMAMGIIMRDGLAVLAGLAIGAAWIAIIVLLGEAGLRALISVLV